MAVMDFRDGGFGFTRSRKRAQRDHDFEQHGWDDLGAALHTAPMAQPPLGERLGRLTQYVGAVASVALMIGMISWGVQLATRDVTNVPVIKALAGDARIAPDEPGGELTSHTGLAVSQVSGGTGARAADRVALAPNGAALTDGDVAMGALGATAHEPANARDLPVSFDADPRLAVTDAEAAREQAERAAAMAAVNQSTITDQPASEGAINEVVLDENGQQSVDIAAALAEAQSAAPAISAARPAPRPARAVRVASAAPAPARASDAAPAAAPAPVQASASGHLVQIGAFDSNDLAAGEWRRLAGKHGDLFSGKGQVIQQHDRNGRTFWRLRVAGFDSRDDARRFCAALQAQGTDCLPISQ